MLTPAVGLVLALQSIGAPPAPCERGTTGCVVEARVGAGRLRLQVDTGADLTVLTAEGMRKAGLRLDRNSPILLLQGVGGASVAILVRAPIEVGGNKEESILIAIAPDMALGRADGLLGMSFLERYRTTLATSELKLVPIDEGEKPRPGGHGESWWTLRFRQARQRQGVYERMVASAKAMDRGIAGEIGVDPNGVSAEELAVRLRTFMTLELDELTNEGGRHAVPLAWRR